MRIKNWTHQMSCDLTSFLITWLNKISSFTLEDSRVPCLRAGMLKSYCLSLNSNSITYYVILSESGSCSVVSDSLWPHELYSPWNSLGQNTGVGSLSLLLGDLPNPGIELRSPALQADSLPAQSQGKPRNTGVGSPSLLQRIFLTQESNRGLLHGFLL